MIYRRTMIDNRQSPYLNGLRAYWRLEEASGTRVDSRGNNDLTDNNTVTSTTGLQGDCAVFTASNSEYLSRASNSELSPGDIDWSAIAWVYPVTSFVGGRKLLYKDSGTTDGNRDFQLQLAGAGNSKLQWLIFNSANGLIGNVTSTDSLTLTTWNMVYVYHSAGDNEVGVSINNGTVTSTSTSGACNSGSSPFLIGASTGGANGWNGRMDEIGFWHRTLESSELTWLYNSGSGRSYSDLVAA